jgi:hypothetical protein
MRGTCTVAERVGSTGLNSAAAPRSRGRRQASKLWFCAGFVVVRPILVSSVLVAPVHHTRHPSWQIWR